MTITELAKGIGTWLSVPWPLVCALLLALLLGWLCWRTRSSHILLSGLWRLLMRRSRSSDREISKWIESRERLMDFRYFFSLRARTLAQARRIGRWAEANDEDLQAVADCGSHFDLETCALRDERIPAPALVGAFSLSALLLFVVGLAALAASWTDQALLQFTESGTMFLLDRDRAATLVGNGRVTRKSCESGTAPVKFSVSERDALCDAISKPGIEAFIHDNVVQQRAVFGPAAGMMLLFALSAWSESRRGSAARAMQKRLRQRQDAGEVRRSPSRTRRKSLSESPREHKSVTNS